MASLFHSTHDGQELQQKIDKKASDIFEPRMNEPQLQMSRIHKNGEVMSLEKSSEVANPAQLKELNMVNLWLFSITIK